MGDNRERFERELHRLRGYRFKRLLVVGSEAEILAVPPPWRDLFGYVRNFDACFVNLNEWKALDNICREFPT
jgi:hypothetical protein